MPRHHCFTPVLKSLHWLKIPERIHFKVLSLTYNSGTPSVHLPLRTFHNSANPLYPILLLSHPFSTPCHFPSDVLQQSHIHNCTTSLEWPIPPELRTFSLPPPSSSQITKHHLHPAEPAPHSVTPRTFHSKLKFHLFKNSYPDSPDPLSPHSSPKVHPL